MNIHSKMSSDFTKSFNRTLDNSRLFFAPGRVNLIGEHTDYNGGHVFPCALEMGTYALAATNSTDSLIRVFSANFPDGKVIEFNIEDLATDKISDWSRYVKGIFATLLKDSLLPAKCGLDICYYGNLPGGAGLSSSASIEVVTTFLIKSFFNISIDGVEIAKISQDAENNYVGMRCGIMDQFSVSMGKRDHAILLDCNTLQYEYAPLDLVDTTIIITNSNKKHSLVSSEYNTRRKECEDALHDLQSKFKIKHLCDLSPAEFEENSSLITNPIARRRAKHAIYENNRTIEAVKLLKAGDLVGFGELMYASHASLKDDYEVSAEENDVLVDLASATPGVLGSRITGAGFGGCTVSLVQNSAVDGFKEFVGKKYLEKTGNRADFYVTKSGDGVHELTLES